MAMHWIDWSIVAGLFVIVAAFAVATKKYLRSVADFLAANRCAGPYMLAVADGAAQVGAITVVALFEVYYTAGFPAYWWYLTVIPVMSVISLTGWIFYRFRQTRAMTIAQFFEIRYSRNFRVFMGIVAFVSGIVNFGIFPAVGARFFIYFCGLPQTISVAGLFGLSTFAMIMILLLSISVYFTLAGGQITVMVTDFIQGIFTYIALSIVLVVLLTKVSWPQIAAALAAAPADKSMVNPFHTSAVPDFNVWYFLIAMFGAAYGYMSWQGNQGYNCAARTPHAALMGRVLGSWRYLAMFIYTLIPPICAYAIMHNPAFSSTAASVKSVLAGIDNKTIAEQMTVSVVLSQILPVGVLGLMCAIMFAAFIANHNTYLHSWGIIFIQDVVLPLRKKTLTPQQHIKLLRMSVIGVAVFIFLFSLLFRQTQYIMLFFSLTGAIYLGGAGAVVIGGLYWKRGTVLAAWMSMILGSSIAVAGIIIHQIRQDFFLNGQWILFIAMVSAMVCYFVVSLLGNANFNMDKMLHRGSYKIDDDIEKSAKKVRTASWIREKLGLTTEFTFSEKIIYAGTTIFTAVWTTAYLLTIVYNLFFEVSFDRWAAFWHGFIWFGFGLVVLLTVWMGIGGMKDLKDLFALLQSSRRNHMDNGQVRQINTDNSECKSYTLTQTQSEGQ